MNDLQSGKKLRELLEKFRKIVKSQLPERGKKGQLNAESLRFLTLDRENPPPELCRKDLRSQPFLFLRG